MNTSSQINQFITTPLHREQTTGIWYAQHVEPFSYSDGVKSEKYLAKVFTIAHDLSSQSAELETFIKDWPSEYHLSRKRAQLFQGFEFDRQARVLEVGCGCGAITRFLGETFDHVLAVEGSITRARLAKLRIKDLSQVEIVCAPFQELSFSADFDIIFCVGVLEYAGSYVSAPDPYQHLLELFSRLLNPNGILIVAIENQFGLKYFTGTREDHTGLSFEGIEGYPHRGHRLRTFGYQELKQRLRSCFNHIDFFFPYPDYKLPDCVLTDEFLRTGKAGELVGLFAGRDENRPTSPLFDEKMALLELDRNQQLPIFANSFLAIAGKATAARIIFPQAGILFNRNERLPLFQTVTRFLNNKSAIEVDKTLANSTQPWSHSGRLRCCPRRELWRDGLTLHTRMLQRVRRHDLTLPELFAPVRAWLDWLNGQAHCANDRLLVPGTLLDTVWHNIFMEDSDTVLHHIDQEWEWSEPIGRNVLIIRTIFRFLEEARTIPGLTPGLRHGSTKTIIRRIADTLGVPLSPTDFREFVELESELLSLVTGRPLSLTRRSIRRILVGPHSLFVLHRHWQRLRTLTVLLVGKIATRLSLVRLS